MRKQIVVALCIGLLLLLIPLVAGAEIVDSGTCGDNLTWTIDDQEILTISGVGEMIDFPSSSRKEWRSSPFPFNHIVINEGVTRIGVEAFACCTSIKSVSLPNSLRSIGYGAFNLTCLSSVIIPESVEIIEGDAFSDTNLEDVSLPVNTKTGPRVFKNCYGLADANGFVILNNTLYDYCGEEYNITIPDGVEIISCLYSGYVRQVIIPDSVTRIEEEAFAWCPELVSVIIPQSVVYIGSGAFEGCYNLTNAVIPDSVSYLGDDIFAGCYNLCDADGFVIANNTLYAYYGNGGKVFIPDGVTCIGKEAFYDSYNRITGIVIPETVTKIGDSAFSGTDITTINIPAGVTEIGVSVFSNCSNLFSINVSPENSSFIVANGALFDKSMKRLIAFPPYFSSQVEFDIPETVQKIDESAFLGCFGLTKITIPDSVTQIGRSAFADCKSLANVVIPGSIKNIPDYCFSYCTGLTNATIMEGITSIGEYAFNNCSGLSSVCSTNREVLKTKA